MRQKRFQLLSEPRKIYDSMISDIKNAKKTLLLETYIYRDDDIGRSFREAISDAAERGVKIKILIDAFGSKIRGDFFGEHKNLEVRFFREWRHTLHIFSANHERNHRKLLIIDSKIVYIGSANICGECLKWRELNLRIYDSDHEKFVKAFNQSWDSVKISRKRVKRVVHKGLEIIQDLPTKNFNPTEKKYISMINNAKKFIDIETPYFVPTPRIQAALGRAVKRGVEVKILLPLKSDLILLDIYRNRYLGRLHKKGVKILYYTKGITHAKLMIVDNRFFLLGSSNLDYRSFKYQYDINLFGKHRKVSKMLMDFFSEGVEHSRPFSYSEWKNRSGFSRIIETMLIFLEKYL